MTHKHKPLKYRKIPVVIEAMQNDIFNRTYEGV